MSTADAGIFMKMQFATRCWLSRLPNFICLDLFVMGDSKNKLKSPGSLAKNKKSIGQARGLIQITEQTRKILGNSKGELKDYIVNLSKEDVLDPNQNLAAGIRWLFHKKDLLSKRLKRKATWEEAVMEYKGLTSQLNEGGTKAKKIQTEFDNFLKLTNETKQ